MKSRSRKVFAWVTVAGWALTAAAAGASEKPAPSITVDTGTLAGSVEGGVETWKGIPYAAPPIGPLRWRAPQPAAPWKGVRQATAYSSDCMQKPFPSDAAPLGTTPAEDCLYANVWRPAGSTAKLPVLFWIYGGGFVNGGSSPPVYSGAALARQGIVVFSFNYRVGRFGTFAHPQLTRQDADGGLLGNYGYMDQIAALKWVKRNIAAFGGDPANVTIVGESAGGRSVNTLLTSPMAQGLFAKAVIMSGGDGHSANADGIQEAEKIGVAFAATKGISADDPEALTRLRALSADAVTDGLNLSALFNPAPGPRTFGMPVADGRIAVDSGAAYRTGAFAKVPIMIGATSADIGGRTGYMTTGARNTATTIAAAGVPVYAYRFSYVAESSERRDGAQHATDIPFFFDTIDVPYQGKTTPRDAGMSKAVSTYLVNFAKTGDPNGAGLPAWPRYSRAADVIANFAEDGTVVPQKDPWGPELDAASAPAQTAAASPSKEEQEILTLSRDKWRWMSERNVEALDALFHDKAVFVHMGGTMSKAQELGVIRGGMIQYKHAEILEASVQLVGSTAILLNRIRLVAVVGGNEVVNPFVVTEVYVQEGGTRKLASLSFTRLLTP